MLARIDAGILLKIQCGMYIISSHLEDKCNAQIATTVLQVTNDPIQISVCLAKSTFTHEMIMASKQFGAAILSQDTPMSFIGKFGYKSGRDVDKCIGINCEFNITGCPLFLDYTLAVCEAEVNSKLDVGTHTIFVGKVLSAKKIQEGTAMTYEYYHTVLKGKSPESAPTYIKI